jgi:inner membrane protein
LDSLTHTVLGACVGEIVAGKKIGKHAMFWGALANNIPDIDVFSSIWMNQADSLLAHRGFTHSILFALVITPVLSLILSRRYPNRNMHFNNWTLMFGSGIFIHLFIDALTCYGTGWFEPFSHARISMNVLFVADPFYTISVFISFLALVVIKGRKKSRRKWAWAGIWISTIYIGYALLNKSLINADVKEELAKKHISYNNYFTTPSPLNSFLWYVVAQNDTGFYVGYRSVFDKTKNIHLSYRSKNENLLAPLSTEDEIKSLKRFSKGYYTAEKTGDTLYMNDIRFGTIGGWDNASADFVFKYCLAKNANNDLVIQKGRYKSMGKDALASLYNRICGYNN